MTKGNKSVFNSIQNFECIMWRLQQFYLQHSVKSLNKNTSKNRTMISYNNQIVNNIQGEQLISIKLYTVTVHNIQGEQLIPIKLYTLTIHNIQGEQLIQNKRGKTCTCSLTWQVDWNEQPFKYTPRGTTYNNQQIIKTESRYWPETTIINRYLK